MSLVPRIQTKQGALAGLDGEVVVLREDSEYLVHGFSQNAEARIGQRLLSWVPGEEAFSLSIGLWFARQMLTIVDGPVRHQVPIRVEANPRKLSAEAAATMLRELDEWLAGSTVGQAGGTHGDLRANGAAAWMVAMSLGPLVPALIRAVRAVLESPKYRRADEVADVALHSVRRVDSATLRWLSRHPDVYQTVQPRSLTSLATENPSLPQYQLADALDHPVNRYLVWGLRRAAARLEQAGESLRRTASAPRASSDSVAWQCARALELESGADSLRSLLRQGPLRSVEPSPITESAILTLHDNPPYARVHALLRLFLSPRFQPEKGPNPAAIRPSFELYELWTFLGLVRALGAAVAPARVTGRKVLKLVEGHARTARCTWSLPDGTLELAFQPKFTAYLARRRGATRFSISRERWPDLTVAWKPDSGAARWLCLDAKYRVERRDLADSFQSAHLYRDSLIWSDHGGRPLLALLLAPAKVPGCEAWFEASFTREYGCGVREVTPGGTSFQALAAEVLRALDVPPAAA